MISVFMAGKDNLFNTVNVIALAQSPIVATISFSFKHPLRDSEFHYQAHEYSHNCYGAGDLHSLFRLRFHATTIRDHLPFCTIYFRNYLYRISLVEAVRLERVMANQSRLSSILLRIAGLFLAGLRA